MLKSSNQIEGSISKIFGFINVNKKAINEGLANTDLTNILYQGSYDTIFVVCMYWDGSMVFKQ